MIPLTIFTITVIVVLVVVFKMTVVIPAREIGVLERLGQFKGTLEPGLHVVIPFVDRVRYRHDMRERVLDVPMQTCITRDNIQVAVDGDVYFKVVDPVRASYGIANYVEGIMHLAMTTMRSEIGKLDLDTAFSERDTINANVVREIDHASDPWGVKVLRYEVETVQPGESLTRTLEQQMSAERAKRAEITLADAERISRTNVAEGDRQFAINVSEGERQRRIDEAEGRAQAIAIESEATAQAIARVAAALRRPGGAEAARLQITERFVEQLGRILQEAQVSVVPSEIASVETVFRGLEQVTSPLRATGGAPPPPRPPHHG
jgi:regulator of protease activity HflC (stomatin/prohibitin superfamily)